MKVRSVGVRRVWDCMLCTCVSEEGGDGEGAYAEAPSLCETRAKGKKVSGLVHDSKKRNLALRRPVG